VHARKVQGVFREQEVLGRIQGTFRKGSGNIQTAGAGTHKGSFPVC
jgi:hypothetical protein